MASIAPYACRTTHPGIGALKIGKDLPCGRDQLPDWFPWPQPGRRKWVMGRTNKGKTMDSGAARFGRG